MNFELSEEQAALQRSARAFLDQRFGIAALQALALGSEVPDLWPEMAGLGWAGLMIPDTYGGSGGDLLDAVMLVEQLGYAAVPSPFIHSAVVAAGVIGEIATEAQRARWLPPLANGERTIALAIAEDSGEFAPAAIRASGAPGVPLSGTKLFVKDADRCHELLLCVRAQSGELNLLLVPAGDCRLERMETLSGERLFAVGIKGVTVNESCRLGPAGGGKQGLQRILELGALARAAESVGLAQRVLDIVVEHLGVREQSGQPLGSFQALQHSSADMLRNIEGARAIVQRAAWEFSRGAPAKGVVSMAKAYASDACLDVVRRGHQLMGAIGYCEEHPLHILHKRIHAAALDFGDAADHWDTVADALGLAG